MSKFKFGGAIAAMAVATLTLAACSGGAGAADEGAGDGAKEGPIKAVVFGGLGAEGILQNNSVTSVTAATASVAEANARGGIMGREIELTVIDDTGDPTVAVTRLRELLAGDDRPDVVMNSGPSTVAEALVPILSQEKIFSFNIGPTASTGDPKVSPYNFDLSPSVPDYVGSFVQEIGDKGYENVAILHGSSSYGELFGELAAEMFGDADLKVTDNQVYDVAALDMTPQLEALKATNPDVLVLDAYGAPLGYVLQGIDKLGWDVPILGNTSVSATGLIATEPPAGVLGTDQLKNLTMQVFNSTKFNPDDAAVNDAVALMLESGDIKSSLIPAYNFDAMLLYQAAAEKAGSLDAEAVTAAMLEADVQKAAKTVLLTNYAFSKDSHTPHASPDEYLFIAPGPLVNGQYQ